MARPIGRQNVRLVCAGEYEGLPRERRRIVERPAIKQMAGTAIDAVELIEEEVVIEIGAQGLRRRYADIDLVTQKGGCNRVPGRNVDQDLHVGMSAVEPRDSCIEALANQARYDLDRNPASHFLGEVAEPLWNIANQRVQRAACLGNQHAFVGQLESTWSAPAQRHAQLGLESLKRETKCWLLAQQRASRAADPPGLGNLVKRLQEIPINIATEIGGGGEHDWAPLIAGLAPGGGLMFNSTTTWRTSQRHYEHDLRSTRSSCGRRTSRRPERPYLAFAGVETA